MSWGQGVGQVTQKVVDFDKAKQKPMEAKKSARLQSMQDAFEDYRSKALGTKKAKKKPKKKSKKGRKGA
jgi:hypothetical protein